MIDIDADRVDTILVVEDEPDLRALIRKRLEEDGFKVIEAENGAIGLTKAKANQPSLILLDIRMPESTGYEMLKSLRESGNWGANVPVIFLSNVTPQGDDEIEDLMALRPADYFIKSNSDLGEVTRKIRHVLRG